MKMKRREVETTLESTIASLRNTLEFVREQEQREREEKILLHRPRPAEPQPMRRARATTERAPARHAEPRAARRDGAMSLPAERA